MSSKYSRGVYKDLGGAEEPVDFDFFDDSESDQKGYQLNNQPSTLGLEGKQGSASISCSPRSTDLESARSAASSRSSLNVRLPSVSPRDLSTEDSEDDHDDYKYKNNNLKEEQANSRPKTSKPGSRGKIITESKNLSNSSGSDSDSYSSSFTSGSSSEESSSGSSNDSDTDSGSVTDVSPLQSPNSTGVKNVSGSGEKLIERPKTSKNTRLHQRERHHSESTIKSKKENVKFADCRRKSNGKKSSEPRWNESEAQELSMLLKAVLEMEEAPKTLVKMPVKQHSRPSSAKSSVSNASGKSFPNKRMNMSFSNDRVRQIDRENQRLLQQIMSTSGVELGNSKSKVQTKKSTTGSNLRNGTHTPMSMMSHAAMRRQREQRRIEIENMQILKRIESAKASREVTKEALLDDHYRMTRYAQQVSKSPLRPTSAKSTGKQNISEASSLLNLYSHESGESSRTASRSSSRPSSAKKSSFRPTTRRPKQAWDDHWQSSGTA